MNANNVSTHEQEMNEAVLRINEAFSAIDASGCPKPGSMFHVEVEPVTSSWTITVPSIYDACRAFSYWNSRAIRAHAKLAQIGMEQAQTENNMKQLLEAGDPDRALVHYADHYILGQAFLTRAEKALRRAEANLEAARDRLSVSISTHGTY